MFLNKSKWGIMIILSWFMIYLGLLITNVQAEDILEENTSDIQTQIDNILTDYGITDEMSDNEIADVIIQADSDAFRKTLDSMEKIESSAENLSKEEFDKLDVELYGRFCNVVEQLAKPVLISTVNMLDDTLTLMDTENTIKNSSGTVTATAKGNLFGKKTNTITITNESGKKAVLKFDYVVSAASSYDVAGTTDDPDGTVSCVLEEGASIKISITSNSGLSNTTVTLTLKNISLTLSEIGVNVQFNYDESIGTVKADGSIVADGEELTTTETPFILSAIPESGYSFLGWVDAETNVLISNLDEIQGAFEKDTIVNAVFVNKASDIAWFSIENYMYNDLNQAIAKANTAEISNKTIVLLNNGTLSDSYEIPTGVTLLIPYDDANTLCKAEPTIHENIYTSPTVYRTLTMASGAKITVEGAISVSGSQSSKYDYNGQPSGPLGFIKMSSGSNITINNGANLYVWGYITGAGTVTAKTGATVYECFQVMDYRGGDVTSKMQNNKYNVFPMSQYYIQNIEVPLTMEYGVIEYGHFAVQVTGAGKQKALVPFVGDNGMFNITSGTVTKDYDENTDRLIIDINGDVSCNPYEFSIKVALIGNVTLKTENYVLPLNQNITMNAYSGTMTVSQDLALLPETEINIAEKATCKLINDARIIAYDLDDWGGYCDTGNVPFVALRYAPGRINNRTSLNKDATVLINGFLDASEGYVYTTENGANIYSDGTGSVKVRKGTETVTYQVTTNDTTISGYPEISITSAQLKNKDNTFTLTSKSTAEANTYTYENGRWTCKTHIDVDPADYTCDVCGKRLAVELVGRTLKYVDKINVICLFEFLDQSMLVDENSDGIIDNAGMVVWDSKESVTYNEDGSPKGYSQLKVQLKHYPDNPGYYYAETDGITTPNLHKSAYYAGYVKVEDQYYYSDVFEYGPSIYAYNMLEKETGENANQTTPKTKNLCVTLLNYISAAQQYFPCADDDANTVVPSESELVNIALDEITTGKDINADGALEDLTKFGVYDLTAPEKDSSAEANGSIFMRVGKNLYFTDTVNLAAMFEFAPGTSWSDSGTIFWTESQWTAMGENPTPNIEDYGSGKLESPLNSYNNSSTIYYAMCPISIAPKDMADTKIYSMGYVEVNNVYQYSNVKAYGIEDYIANIVEDNKNAENGTQGFYMKLLAQQLYHYERAARAALLNQ